MLNFLRQKRTPSNANPNASAVLGLMSGGPWLADIQSVEPIIAAMMEADLSAPIDSSQAGFHRVGNLAVIYITGVIVPNECRWTHYGYATSCESIRAQITQAAADPSISRILLKIDTPGGIARGVDEASTVIYSHRGTKPIISHVVGSCCSAGYYLASSADMVFADPSTLTGSVGAIYTHQDFSGYLDQLGISVTHVTHGRHKADGAGDVPLTEQTRSTLQEMVDSVGQMFTAAVGRNRSIDPAAVLEQYGQAKFFIASKALEIGLIDGVVDPLKSIEDYFEMTTSTNGTSAATQPTETQTETRADGPGVETQSPAELGGDVATRVTAVETSITTLTESLTKISDQLAGLTKAESSVETKPETTETKTPSEESPQLDALRQSVEKLTAKVDHLSTSSSDPASGSDAESSNKGESVYSMPGKKK